jgi:hypothetical protein
MEAFVAQGEAKRFADVRLVVCDEDARFDHCGRCDGHGGFGDFGFSIHSI